jgi:hypothetical protein
VRDYELLFPTDYIKHVELQGQDVTLTIAKVDLEDLQLRGTSKKKRKGVLSFKETPKKLVLCRENGETLKKLYGRDADEWIGKQVTIYPDPNVMFGPNKVGGTRIRAQMPKTTTKGKATPAGLTAPPDADIAPPGEGEARS